MLSTTYLIRNGDAEEVLAFYRDALGGELDLTRFAGSPTAGDAPAEWGEKILHGLLVAPGGVRIGVMDAPPSRAVTPGSNIALCLQPSDPNQVRALFEKLSAGGQIRMPLEATFWSPLFGMLIDRFGTIWMLGVANEP